MAKGSTSSRGRGIEPPLPHLSLDQPGRLGTPDRHSHTRTTLQPARRSGAVVSASLARFRERWLRQAINQLPTEET
jgi:hypothetical protein